MKRNGDSDDIAMSLIEEMTTVTQVMSLKEKKFLKSKNSSKKNNDSGHKEQPDLTGQNDNDNNGLGVVRRNE